MTSCTQIRGRAGWRASFKESTGSEVGLPACGFHPLLRETH